MEAWIVAIAAVFTIVYQAVIGPRSIAQWLQDSKKREVESELVQAARAQLQPEEVERIERGVGIRKALRRALSDLYLQVKRQPGKSAVKLFLIAYFTFVGLVIILFVCGAFMALIGGAFNVIGMLTEGQNFMRVSLIAVLATLGVSLFPVVFVASAYSSNPKLSFKAWWNDTGAPAPEQEREPAPKRRRRTSVVATTRRTARSRKPTLE